MKILNLAQDPYRLEFVLVGLPEMTNAVLAMPLRKRMNRKKFWKERVVYGLMAAKSEAKKFPPQPLKRARLTLTRHSSDRPDPDGLTSGFKHIIDGLRLARVLAEDKFENIGFPRYRWRHAPQGKGYVTVLVEELPADFVAAED